MKQRITLYVDSDVWRAFRIRCLREKMSASAVVERWMNQLEEWPLEDTDQDTIAEQGQTKTQPGKKKSAP